jgi:adenine-specific DNA-methyltransferase
MDGYEIDKSQMNRLIWGDNLLAMQALLTQKYAGKIQLIYVDPPFASSADYSFQLTIEGKQVDKEANIIERLAYTDTWEGGKDSYLDMLYPRLHLMKRLMSDNGSIYLHVDWHVAHYVKIVMDEVFGYENFRNQVIWKRSSIATNADTQWRNSHDILLFYTKTSTNVFNVQYGEYSESSKKHFSQNDEKGVYQPVPLLGSGRTNGETGKVWRGIDPNTIGKNGMHWLKKPEVLDELDREGKIYWPSNGGLPRLKYYLYEAKGRYIPDVWDDIYVINSMAKEALGYPTQKPEALLERIIKASSNEGDLVADFFCGSGTTIAVAEKLNRRWIGCNLDKVGIQVSRNRLVNQGAKPFLLENIGNYQRHMIYLSGSKINEMQRIILKLYGAAVRSDRPDLGSHTPDGQEPELVYVGYPDRPVTAKKVIELAQEAEILDGTGYKTLVVLAWDYDYNFNTELENRKAALRTPLKVNIKPLTIPPEIYNYLKKAKNEDELDSLRDKITFHEKPYLKVSKPEVSNAGDGKVVITLKIDRYVLMNYPIPETQQVEFRKAIKDNFAALIDYWAIDWDYDGKTFYSRWQAIRGNGKQASTVVTMAASPELPAGKRAIAVRLVDVFGNDASATVEVK